MSTETRRSFNKKMLRSLMAYGLIETLYARDLLADAVKPVIRQWVIDLQSLCADVKGRKLKDIEFQAKLEELYRRVDLAELVRFLELDRLAGRVDYPERGAASLGFDLSRVEGLPKGLAFGRQIFALKKRRAIVPHGHNNMCTGFIVLRGTFVGKHFDRVEDQEDHYLIKPTIDRTFEPGECSTISDHKDNVHWFTATSDTGFIFNIHVDGYNPANPKASSRVYVDPAGEKVKGGLIRARVISSTEAHKKYG
jgi:hypothetical protein